MDGSETIMDSSNHFTTDEVFKGREALVKWTRDVGKRNGIIVVITKSDSTKGRKPRITFGCERGGLYKQRNKEVDKQDKKRKRKSGTKKCGCPFELKGLNVSNDDWIVKVVCGEHNHPAEKNLEGHSFAGRLSEEETALLVDMTMNSVPPKEILITLKQRDAFNATTIKTIYNTRQKFKARPGSFAPKLLVSKAKSICRETVGNPQESNGNSYNSVVAIPMCSTDEDGNIIQNPRFEDDLNNWSGIGCKILLLDSVGDGKILPFSGKFFASATERTQTWNGIQQEITGRVQRKLAYEVTAVVRIFGNNVTCADVRATLSVQTPNLREQYISIANLQASDKEWVQLQGKFLINGAPSRVIIYLDGPPPGTDILVNNLVVKHAQKLPPSVPPLFENAVFGVNIVENSNLNNALDGWFQLGSCTLSVGTGSPLLLPPMARDSIGSHEPLSGRYIHVTNRTETWMGPAQLITDKLKLYFTYQVSAWIRVGPGAIGSQNVNVALSVDNQCVNGGQVEAHDDRWHEIGGSFRIEKQPSKVMVYIQGPSSGVDLMVAGLQIFPVNRQARFKQLKKQTDKIRKRDIILKLSASEVGSLVGAFVKVTQSHNSFPFGSCINRSNIDNEDFVDFFVKNFNWAVFENEMKWDWTEPQQGNINYKDADELLELCKKHNIKTRGHCIFWEVEAAIQSWVHSLNKDDLMVAVENRLNGLLSRYKNKLRHYNVNNEMLHGSFYQDRLGKDIRSFMFKTAHQLDPSATLFLNDYHVEDRCDTSSSPDKYIQHVLDLQEQGAPVGGIGLQGHIDRPVGPIVCSALDKLGVLGLPIWFTELDVSSINEYVRADDLEVMLREGFAHPAVEGIILWGFWELFMSRNNAHLVDAEGNVNEAGKRYLSLKQEWLSQADGHVNDEGEFRFRGFHGAYSVEILTLTKKILKTFVVDKGEAPLEVNINL